MKNQILLLLALSLGTACDSKSSDTSTDETSEETTEDTETEDTETEDTETEDTDTEDTSNDDPNIECTAHSDCDEGSFCSLECFTGDCGENGDIPSGTPGQFCQPCVECEMGTDSITGDCDVCS